MPGSGSDPLGKMEEGWAHLKQLPEILLYGLSSQKLSGYSCVLPWSSRASVENVLWKRRRGGQSFACSENATASLPPYESNLKSEKVTVKSLSRVQLFATQWTVAYQSPQSMEFSRQECWSGLPFPSPGHPWIEPGSPALLAAALLSEPPGKQSQHPPKFKVGCCGPPLSIGKVKGFMAFLNPP